MKYLDLSKDQHGYRNHMFVKAKHIVFPDGTYHCRIMEKVTDDVTLMWRGSDDIMRVFIAGDALRRQGVRVHLMMPYFPGARQDREAVEGDAVAVEAYASLIESFSFESVSIFDAHSEATSEAFKMHPAPIVRNNHRFVYDCIVDHVKQDRGKYDLTVVVPDEGAKTKSDELVTYLKVRLPDDDINVVYGKKDRDPDDGRLTGFSVEAVQMDFRGREVIVVDDICDGGGTFMGLMGAVSRIAEPKHSHLIVSHGIFSKGLTNLYNSFTTVSTTDSFRNVNALSDFYNMNFDYMDQFYVHDVWQYLK